MLETSGQPKTASQIIRESINNYSLVFKKIFLVTTVFSLFFTIPNYYSSYFINTYGKSHKGNVLLYVLLILILTSLFNGVMVYLTGKTIQREIVTLYEAIQRTFQRFLTIIGSQILYIFIFLVIGAIGILISKFSLVLLGILLFLIFGVMLVVRLYFILPLIMFDNTNMLQSLSQSYQLTIHYWWRTLFLIFIAGLPYIPFMIVEFFLPKIGQSILVIIQTILVLPFSISLLYLQYHDLKTRQAITNG